MIEIETGEKPIIQTGLDGALSLDVTNEKEYVVLNGFNLGNNTLALAIPFHEFYDRSAVANELNISTTPAHENEAVAQRSLNPEHSLGLAKYMIKGLFAALGHYYAKKGKVASNEYHELLHKVGTQPYLALQPMTANIRSCKFGGADLRFKKTPDGKLTVFLSNHHTLWIVDGQHRREGMNILHEFLRDLLLKHQYPKKPLLISGVEKGQQLTQGELAIWTDIYEIARSITTVLVEVHLGLTPDQERQLFFDLNNYARKVESALAFNFDQSNPVNIYIKDELIAGKRLKAPVLDKDKADWKEASGGLTRKDLIAINAILFLNKTNIKGATPDDVAAKKDYANIFWKTVSEIPHFGEANAKQKTVAAQPVVLKALAKLFYSFQYGKYPNTDSLIKLVKGIPSFDFSHGNILWRYYLLPEEDRERDLKGLSSYLPSDADGANRDIGAFFAADGVFRFGAKHNDIFPILGDMIRWGMQLPNRKEN